jgi:hypothetical protein
LKVEYDENFGSKEELEIEIWLLNT